MATKRVMGLDASTTTIGLAVIDYSDTERKLVHYEYFKPDKKVHVLQMLAGVRAFILSRLETYKPDYVALEDIILFMKGHSTAQTISALSILNRTVGLTVYNHMGRPPAMLNVMKVRHTIKLDKILPPKEDIPELVAKLLGIEFPWIVNKKGKRIEENCDMADSIAVALAFITLGPEKAELAPVKKPKKRKKKSLEQTIVEEIVELIVPEQPKKTKKK